MKLKLFGSTLLLAVVSLIAPANADVEELRIGVVGNIRSDQGDIVEGKHEGENIELDIISSSPDFLNIIGSPRPYAMVSVATEGDGVNFGGIGVLWRWEFADGWALEPGFGYIIHDGEIDNPFPDNSPAGNAFEEDNQLLGSRDLFRTSFALEREIGDRFALQLYWQHMSHGQILDSGRNQGLDYVGVRFGYRFDPDTAD
ncbi:MAG: acyloxyacyl hydrolase [Hyphomonadaceae bacterium]|jgi:lipid A 3-O-deacylase|nr:acyloxyacyl hydrolase [Hyphomonadaceae bacterium]